MLCIERELSRHHVSSNHDDEKSHNQRLKDIVHKFIKYSSSYE